MKQLDPASIDWKKGDGLVPAIVQDMADGTVLMLGYMNRQSFEITQSTGQVVFFSRSRQALWRKGETSGHVLEVRQIDLDCDADTILIQARPAGPTCHRGTRSCFAQTSTGPTIGLLLELEDVIDQRLTNNEEGSYVARLAAGGQLRVAQKVGEEGVEFALAAATDDRRGMIEEGADLLFHLLVALRAGGLSISDLLRSLEARRPRKASEDATH